MEFTVRPRLTVCFENEETKNGFVKLHGEKWMEVVKNHFYRQPEGVWQIFDVRNHWGSYNLGSIILDDIGFWVKPKSGLCRKRYLEKMRPSLIRSIVYRLSEIFGEDGHDGSVETYDWLLETYDVTEEEDNSWIDLLMHQQGVSDEIDAFDEVELKKIMDFINDDEAAVSFLIGLLDKYESSKKKYPGKKRRSANK